MNDMNEKYICVKCGNIHNIDVECPHQKDISPEGLEKLKYEKLNLLIKDELKGTFNSIFEFNNVNKALLECLNEMENLRGNIFNYITKYYYEIMRVEKYNENLELIVAERKQYPYSNLNYQSFNALFDALFMKTLEEVKRIKTLYSNIQKEEEKEKTKTEKEKTKTEKENFKQECKEVYNIIFKDVYEVMTSYKPKKRRAVYECLNTNENLEIAWDSIETFITFSEFSKIYFKVMNDIKRIFKEDISYKRDIKKAGMLGLLIYASKHIKPPSKY